MKLLDQPCHLLIIKPSYSIDQDSIVTLNTLNEKPHTNTPAIIQL